MVKNYMEVLVDEIYNEVKEMYGNCTSEKCIHNIKSSALNNLPPAYFSHDTEPSEIKAFLLQRQRRIAVLAKVAEAADSVCGSCSNRKKN